MTGIYSSVMVQQTILSGAGVDLVSIKNGNATHWSLYLVRPDGSRDWKMDIPIHKGNPAISFGKAYVEAAQLSMQYQLPIQKVF